MIECRTIKELCSVVVDCPHSTPTWTAEGKIVVRNNNIKNGRIDFSSPSYTDDEHYQQRIKRATPQGGDIIITREAPMGEVGMIPEGIVCCLGQRMVLLRANPDICDNYYLLYSLQSRYVQHQISWSEGTGTTVSNLRIPHLEQLKIPYLPLSKQRQVSSVLRCLEEKIKHNRVINDNLQQQAFALFDRLMIEAVDTECQVSEIAYLNPKRPLAKNKVARCIDMSQLSTSGAFPSGWEMKPFTGGMRFTNGDTLLARITPCLENGKTAYIDFLDDEEIAFGSTEYIVLAPKEDIPPEYLYCLARYPAFVDYAVKNMNGSSGRQRVSADTIGQFVIPCPSETAIKDFGKVASALFMKMKNNSLENLKLCSLRDTILPKLMAGEIDVSNIQF